MAGCIAAQVHYFDTMAEFGFLFLLLGAIAFGQGTVCRVGLSATRVGARNRSKPTRREPRERAKGEEDPGASQAPLLERQ